MSFSLYWTCALVHNRKRALTIEERLQGWFYPLQSPKTGNKKEIFPLLESPKICPPNILSLFTPKFKVNFSGLASHRLESKCSLRSFQPKPL